MTDGDDQDGLAKGLQMELFHPESERKPGDGNIQLWGFDVHPVVFPVALLVVALFVGATLVLGDQAAEVYWDVRTFFEAKFGWFFLLSVNVFIAGLLFFAFSKYGEIRIGGVEAEKGIGLMFFSVSEPLFYYSNVPGFYGGDAGTGAAGVAAMTQTFFHWGIHPWAIYGLVGLSLAFFSFNRGLPLTFRSIFWPLLGERIYDWPGHLIDLVTVFATLFGLATSLGLGVKQINRGLSYILGPVLGVANVPTGIVPQVVLIAVITGIATASVAAGLEDGVKRLSTLNVYLMLALLGFVLVAGPTVFIFGAWVQGLGSYLGNLPTLAFFTGALGAGQSTVDSWTVFYWAWWIAWSPFVGTFIARISKGRTVREFVVGVLVIPSLFSTIWLATFGGSALYNSLQAGGAVLATYERAGQTVAMFSLLQQFPFGAVSGLLAVLLVVTFFVTSSDSGSLVVDHLTSGGKHDVPKIQRIFWATTEGGVAALLLYGGGLNALQTAAIATGFPFAIVLIVMCYTLYLGLDKEYELLQSEEFNDRVQEISDEDVDIDTSRREVVTDIQKYPESADD
jgi:choline/carnitine/betaine transport